MTTPNIHAVVPVNELNFELEVEQSTLPVLVDVSATWCGPCKIARPIVAELAKQHEGALKVVEIDGEESPNLAARLGVRGYPTFIAISNGAIVDRRLGFGGKRPLAELAQVALAAARD
jgi:thioredoxin 1